MAMNKNLQVLYVRVFLMFLDLPLMQVQRARRKSMSKISTLSLLLRCSRITAQMFCSTWKVSVADELFAQRVLRFAPQEPIVCKNHREAPSGNFAASYTGHAYDDHGDLLDLPSVTLGSSLQGLGYE